MRQTYVPGRKWCKGKFNRPLNGTSCTTTRPVMSRMRTVQGSPAKLRASTSADGLLWYKDAEYFYYPHGPLEHVELGQSNVQGVDYTYTLQGWLKGINSDRLAPQPALGCPREAIAVSRRSLAASAKRPVRLRRAVLHSIKR